MKGVASTIWTTALRKASMLPSEKEKDLLGGLIRQNGRGQRGTKALLSHLRRRAVKTTNSVGGDTVCSGRRFAPYPASGPLKSGWTSPTHILNLGDKSEGTTPKARPPATNFLPILKPHVSLRRAPSPGYHVAKRNFPSNPKVSYSTISTLVLSPNLLNEVHSCFGTRHRRCPPSR